MSNTTAMRGIQYTRGGTRKATSAPTAPRFVPPILKAPKAIPVPACWVDEETGALRDVFSVDDMQRAVDDYSRHYLH